MEIFHSLFLSELFDGVFDGILTAPHWADTERLLNSKLKSISALELKQAAARLRYHINDFCSIDALDLQKRRQDPTPYSARRMTLEVISQKIRRANPKTPIRLCKQRIIRDTIDLGRARHHLEQAGCVGMILKDFDGPYRAGPDPGLIVIRFKSAARRGKP